MAWVRIDDHFPEHPKVIRLGRYLPFAVWLHLCALAYCNRNLTNGKFHRALLESFFQNRDEFRFENWSDQQEPEPVLLADIVAALIAVGMWEELDSEWLQIHDYLDYQPSKRQVTRERKRGLDRQKKWQERKRKTNAVNNTVNNAVNNGGITAAPIPTPSSTTRTRTGNSVALNRARHALTREPQSDGNLQVITKIAHEVIEQIGEVTDDVPEAVKALCAQRRIVYDGTTVRKAIESAQHQRRH